MSHAITTLLAVPFTWTPDATYDVRLVFAAGSPTTLNVTVTAGTWRHHLAPTTGTVADFLRALQSAINTALTTRGAGESCTVTLSDRARVTLALSSGTCTWTFTTALAAMLGLATTGFSATGSVSGTHLPRHLYAFLGGDSKGARPITRNAARATLDGRVVGIRSGVYHRRDEIALEFIPATPTHAASADDPADWSCWEPDHGGGTSVPWTCAELLVTALAQTCALTRDWGPLRTSTTLAYELVSIDPGSLEEPKVEQQFPGLSVWKTWTLGVLYQADATSPHLPSRATRA